MSIGFKELILILAIIGALLWVRMFRTRLEGKTAEFMYKPQGPKGGGFGWKGLLVAFLIGMVCCCAGAFMVFRIWLYYHPMPGV